jgi:cell division protein FtsB
MSGAGVWKRILPYIKNKFILTSVVFLLWMLIFDNSNWIDMFGVRRKILSLEDEKLYYQRKIESDREKLNELRTNNENLEKYAREQYLMKKPNEEIFIVEE